MNEEELKLLIEADQRSKSNMHRIDQMEDNLRELAKEQKAIYSIASSVEVIATKIQSIEEKVDNTNKAVDEQSKSWHEAEARLVEKYNEIENKPYRETAKNVSSVRLAVITAVCTLLATGIIALVVNQIQL